ncbi:MAG: hypothetical protein KME40_34765 [Komarekiella atlantica HA4396-MV6]|jgi:hypothetical protein|nr:hypothetical protein [Komarekiella atlantica HA4396-MV6]
MAKNDECPVQEGVEVRLSGVVCIPHTPHLNFNALDKWIISSFRETRFCNVLKRARVLPQTSWFWHHSCSGSRLKGKGQGEIKDEKGEKRKGKRSEENPLPPLTFAPDPLPDFFLKSSMHISDLAIAIIACNTNDYKQILIKQNQLAQAVQELAPQSELLLLISSDQNFVFGTVLETLEVFSTHILFTQKKESREGWDRWRSQDIAIHNSPASNITISTRHQANDLALCSNPNNRRY